MAKRVPHVLVGTVTLGANATDTINVQTAGHPYFIRGIVAKSTGAFNLQIQPTDSNKNLFTVPIDSELVTGTQQGSNASGPFRIDGAPARFPSTPLRVEKASTIIITVTDTSGAGNTVTVGLEGYRLEAGQ